MTKTHSESTGAQVRSRECRRMAVAVFLCALWPGFALAQSPSWETYNTEGETLLKQGRYTEAAKMFREAVRLAEEFELDDPRVVTTVKNLSELFRAKGDNADAELLRRMLVIIEKGLGPENRPEDLNLLAMGLSRLGMLYYIQGRYAQAEQPLQRAVRIYEKTLGPEHPNVARSLNYLGLTYFAQGQYRQAAALHRRTTKIWETALGPDHPDVATSLNNLAEVLRTEGRYGEAEPLYLRALAILEKALGPEDSLVARGLSNLGLLYEAQARYTRAESLLRRALAIHEKVFGPDHPDVAVSLNNLAMVYEAQGRYAQAEALYHRSVTILEKNRGRDHLDVAGTLNNLAALYYIRGQHSNAEPLLRRALQIREKALGPEHPTVALGLNNLAEFYFAEGRYAEAAPLYLRSLAIKLKTLGPDHPSVALTLHNLAGIYYAQGEYAQAEQLYRRSLFTKAKTFGLEHPELAKSLNNLAMLYAVQGRYAQAYAPLRRALEIFEKTRGPQHPDVVVSLSNLADTLAWQRQPALARPLYERARQTLLAVGRLNIGLGDEPTHALLKTSTDSLRNYVQLLATITRDPSLGENSAGLGIEITLQDGILTVVAPIEGTPAYQAGLQRGDRIVKIDGISTKDMEFSEVAKRMRGQPGTTVTISILRKGWVESRDFTITRELIYGQWARSEGLEPASSFSPELHAFVVAEQARAGLAQSALAKSGARAAADDPAIARLARQVQDLRNRRQAARKLLAEEYGKPVAERNTERLKNLQKAAQEIHRALTEATDRLYGTFPEYAELVSPEPIDVAGVRHLLRADEALVSFFVLDERLLVWLIRSGQEPVYRDIEVKKADMVKMVARVRASLDQAANPNLGAGRLLPFDVEGSYKLYTLLLAPIREHLSRVTQLIVVPDEVLLPLPFAALVTAEGEPYRKLAEQYTQNRPLTTDELARYAKLPWLVRDYEITVVPSATSLRSLRELTQAPGPEVEPLIAFGDPVLQGVGRQRGGSMLAGRGALVPVKEIRALGRLPGTRKELLAVANALGADPSKALYLGERATEPVMQELNTSGRLGKAQVLAFATHGLIAGELKGLKQPALVLTPPETPNEQNDGLLDLEEILGLKLTNTDWVILSACNTAAPDGSGEGLSGLVRAFFFAGAKSLLVSHWGVEDRATQALMAEVFRRYARDKTQPRSEALRQGMLALMASAQGESSYFERVLARLFGSSDSRTETAYLAHPFAWASFFLVGEGGRTDG